MSRAAWSWTRNLLIAVGCVTLASCASKFSEVEYGPAFHVAPGFAVGEEDATVHPMVGYSYLLFDGGHDNMWQIGGQYRMPLARDVFGRSDVWVGGEASFLRFSSAYDDSAFFGGDSPTANGFQVGVIAGIPIGTFGPFNVSAYGGTSFVRFGDFAVGDMVDTPAGNSIYSRVSLDFQLPMGRR